MTPIKFSIIGSGNVASHLAPQLDKIGDVLQVCSHNLSHAQELASKLRSCKATANISDIDSEADVIIVSVSDDALPQVAKEIKNTNAIVAHTSGSVGIDVLRPASGRIGVFYPLQTFTKNADVDMCQVPFFIEASDDDTYSVLQRAAMAISGKAYKADSQQRLHLHISAVFACNFANHLWSIADDLLQNSGYDLSVLQPLLTTTLHKAMSMPPVEAQTGPAARNDKGVIGKHLAMLSGDEKEIYEIISNSIINKHNHYQKQ